MSDDKFSDTAGLSDFEQQLRSLTPRPPRTSLPEYDRASNQQLLARRTFYCTVGVSASLGAVVGAACTLLMLRGNFGVDLGGTLAEPTASLSNTTAELVTKSVEQADVSTESSMANSQPAIPSPASNASEELQPDWLEHLESLRPGNLGVGTRLVNTWGSRLNAMQQFGQNEATTSGDSLLEPPSAELDSEALQPFHDVRVLPQREWMQMLLSSPGEIF